MESESRCRDSSVAKEQIQTSKMKPEAFPEDNDAKAIEEEPRQKKADKEKETSDDQPEQDEDEAKEMHIKSFPETLHEILASPEYNDAVYWNAKGTTFRVAPTQFSKRILPQFFPGTKFESFTRKLNRWGFKRVVDESFHPNSIVYCHDLFVKEKPELMKGMRTAKKKPTKAQLAAEEAAERRKKESSLVSQGSQGYPLTSGGLQSPLTQARDRGGILGQNYPSFGSSFPLPSEVASRQDSLLHQVRSSGLFPHSTLNPTLPSLQTARSGPQGLGLDLLSPAVRQNQEVADILLRSQLRRQLLLQSNSNALGTAGLPQADQSIADVLRQERLIQQLAQQESAVSDMAVLRRSMLLHQQPSGQVGRSDNLSHLVRGLGGLPSSTVMPPALGPLTSSLPSISQSLSGQPEQAGQNSALLQLYLLRQQERQRQTRGPPPL